MPNPTLTRREAKSITRRRLIEAALELLSSDKDSRNLTTGQIAKRAGVAQPTFYVHFRDMDDLLGALVDARMAELREAFKRSRERIDLAAIASGAPDQALREAFRAPLAEVIERPRMFRIYMQERMHRDSPLGVFCHRLAGELRRDLADDLGVWAEATKRSTTRRELEIMADAFSGMVESVAIGHLDGRYEDIEQMIDVLSRFARGVLA